MADQICNIGVAETEFNFKEHLKAGNRDIMDGGTVYIQIPEEWVETDVPLDIISGSLGTNNVIMVAGLPDSAIPPFPPFVKFICDRRFEGSDNCPQMARLGGDL
jgi:hypothetical protein